MIGRRRGWKKTHKYGGCAYQIERKKFYNNIFIRSKFLSRLFLPNHFDEWRRWSHTSVSDTFNAYLIWGSVEPAFMRTLLHSSTTNTIRNTYLYIKKLLKGQSHKIGGTSSLGHRNNLPLHRQLFAPLKHQQIKILYRIDSKKCMLIWPKMRALTKKIKMAQTVYVFLWIVFRKRRRRNARETMLPNT